MSGPEYIDRSGYVVDPVTETVDYNLPFDPANITKSPIAEGVAADVLHGRRRRR